MARAGIWMVALACGVYGLWRLVQEAAPASERSKPPQRLHGGMIGAGGAATAATLVAEITTLALVLFGILFLVMAALTPFLRKLAAQKGGGTIKVLKIFEFSSTSSGVGYGMLGLSCFLTDLPYILHLAK